MGSVKITGIAKPRGFSQVTRSESNPNLFYISGQPPVDYTGRTIGIGNFETQVIQSFENLGRCLHSIGATFDDIIKITFYVVPMNDFTVVRRIRKKYLNSRRLPATTSVVVTSLVNKDWLIEIEAIAEIKSAKRSGTFH
ncbi:MAG: RidA family protein [Nitrososphaerales archaeon]